MTQALKAVIDDMLDTGLVQGGVVLGDSSRARPQPQQ